MMEIRVFKGFGMVVLECNNCFKVLEKINIEKNMEELSWFRKKILEEISNEDKEKSNLFHSWENIFLIFLSVFFALAASFFAQAYFLKNQKLLIESGQLNEIFIMSLLSCIFIIVLVIFMMKHLEKKMDKSDKRIIELSQRFIKG